MQISPCGEIRIPALPLARYQAPARSFAVPSVEGVHAKFPCGEIRIPVLRSTSATLAIEGMKVFTVSFDTGRDIFFVHRLFWQLKRFASVGG